MTEPPGTPSVPVMTGKVFIAGWKRAVLTVALAYALVLQALLLSTSGAVQAGAVDLPQAVLCLSGPDHTPDHPVPDTGHHALCCILGCHGAGATGGPPPAGAALPRRPPAALAAVPIPEAPALRLASDVLPVGSRAPPRLG